MNQKSIIISYFILLIQKIISEEVWPTDCPLIRQQHCSVSKYYSTDGSCNNLKQHWWGKSDTPLARYLPPQYDDDVGSPRTKAENGELLPNSRKVSLVVHYPKWTIADDKIKLSHHGTIFGQFCSFDMTRISPGSASCTCDSKNPECFNIPTPPNDKIDADQKCIVFTRSKASFPTFNCQTRERQQLNTATHWLDLSQIYGPNEATNKRLRGDNGLLKMTHIDGFEGNYLEFADLGTCTNDSKKELCFRSGDPRVNENMILTSIFTIWAREHNRLAIELKKVNPHWDSERIYLEARRIAIAINQRITYEEFLPIILGRNIMRKYDLLPSKGYFMKYNSNINPQIRNEFSTSAGRYGHTLVNAWGLKTNPAMHIIANISFQTLLIQPIEAYNKGGLDALCRGSVIDRSSGYDAHFTNPIQNNMFQNFNPKAQTHRQSLSALNIQRGLDHGIRSYNAYRKFCKLHVARSFEELRDIPADTIRDLKNVYRSVDHINLFTGIVSEKSLRNAVVGPLGACLLGKQFNVIKHGDRLFYDNGHDRKTRFTSKQLREIRKMTISRILCNTLKIHKIQKNAFLLPDNKSNRFTTCNKIEDMNMEVWKE